MLINMKKVLKPITALVLGLSLILGSEPPETTQGFVQLGPIKEAQIIISSLDGSTVHYRTTTDQQGIFDIDRTVLESAVKSQQPQPDYLKVSSVGGVDIDPDDDGVQKADEYKNVGSSVLGIISVEALLNNGQVAINLITTAVADLLKDKKTVTAQDINTMLGNLHMADINNDGKVDNADAIGYDMVQHDSGAESKLRYQFLDLVHDGDTENRQNYIESLQADKSYVTVEKTKSNGALSISLKPLGDKNHIRYGVDIKPEKELPLVYQKGQKITLQAKSSLYYEECKPDNTCYHREFTYYDGEKATAYYPIPHIGSVYSDPDKIAALRLDYLMKRHYFLHPEEYKAQYTADIKKTKAEITTLEEKLAEVEKKIKELEGSS